MTRYLIGAGLALAAYLLVLASGHAAPIACAPRADIVAQLAARYGEVRVARGLTTAGTAIETFVGPSGTWTMLASGPSGRACVLAVGTDWHGETGAPLLSPKVVPGAERGT
jgi:hypothetical protein